MGIRLTINSLHNFSLENFSSQSYKESGMLTTMVSSFLAAGLGSRKFFMACILSSPPSLLFLSHLLFFFLLFPPLPFFRDRVSHC